VNTREFRGLVAQARNLWPLDTPVRVRQVDAKTLKGDCAESWYGDGHYVIRIARGQCYTAVGDALIHEWTHLRREEATGLDLDGLHDDAFWLLFGEAYRAWHQTS
jgi:hypothetical protein